MLHLIDFPHRFARLDGDALGSIDEVSWISADTVGDDADAVPRGAVLYVRGWALRLNEGETPHMVIVRVDDERSYSVRMGIPRPDVAEIFGNPAFAASGFEAVIPTSRLGAGEHRLTVCVLDFSTGQYRELRDGRSFTTLVPEPVLSIGPYRDGAACGVIDEVIDESNGNAPDVTERQLTIARGATMYVRGWMSSNDSLTPFDEIFAVVDGRHAYRAITGLPRADVAEHLGAPNDTFGFEVRITTAELSPGPHDVDVLAVAGAGQLLERAPVSFRFIVGAMLPSRIPLRDGALAHFDDVVRVERSQARASAAPMRLVRGDQLFVRGWAIDETSSSLAAGVVLVIDGEREVLAVYGLPRGDVADILGNPELAHCGFTAEIRSDGLSAGLHHVACRVLARDGRGALQTAQQFAFELVEN